MKRVTTSQHRNPGFWPRFGRRLCLLMLLLTAPALFAQPVTISIPTDLGGQPGDTVEVPVSLDLGGNSVAALGAALKATNGLLSYVDYTQGPIVPGAIFSVSSPAPDSVRIAFADFGGGPITQNGVLATLRFEIDPTASPGATAALNFNELSATDPGFNSLTINGVSGLVTVPTNQPPLLTALTNQSMNEGTTLDVPVSATDPDLDPLSLNVNNLPTFGQFVDNGDGSGLITFVAGYDNSGIYLDIEVIASDGALSDTVYFDLTVLDTPPPAKILVSEIVVTPTEGEFVEIYNPGTEAVDLTNYYLTDATFASGNVYYYQIVEGGGGGGGSADFNARFPSGATIPAGEYQTIAMNGTAFFTTYGILPTYELFETDPAVPDMLEAVPGSINNQGGLTNSDEVVILYYWNGSNDLVLDVDYLLYNSGSPVANNEAVDKTGVTIDGPDLNTLLSAYLPDTPIANQSSALNHGFGYSLHRIDFTEGIQSPTGGNGVNGADETSEDLNNTFTAFSLPTPNAPYQSPPQFAEVILAASIGGDSQYRSFWVNGAWDASGVYDPSWSGAMVELNDNGIPPDAVTGDHIFTGSVTLQVDNVNTYGWWAGSEDDPNSFLEDGSGFMVTSAATVYPDTLLVDGDGGINEWMVSLAGSFNGWNTASDDLSRDGTLWRIEYYLDAGPNFYKYAVMHQWNAAYGDGGVGAAGSDYVYNAPANGMYIFEFDDNGNTQSVTPVPVTEAYADHITSAFRASVTNEGNIGYLNEFPPAGPGNGFQFNPIGSSGQRLFEGAVMIATYATHVSDAARDENEVFDADFQFLTGFDSSRSTNNLRILETSFDDSNAEDPLFVSVAQTTISGDTLGAQNILWIALDVTNDSDIDPREVHVGGFFDWDVDPASAQDRGQVIVDSMNTISGINSGDPFYIEILEMHPGASPNSWVGVVPLTANIFYGRRIAISDGEVYPPHMTDADKWEYMTANRDPNPNGDSGTAEDHAQVFGLPPLQISSQGTVRYGFALIAGTSLTDLVDNARLAQQIWIEFGNEIIIYPVLGAEPPAAIIPAAFALAQNYPNPFNPSTTIHYALKERTRATIVIYNLLGQRVRTLVNAVEGPGYREVIWDGRNDAAVPVSSGIYICRFTAGKFTAVKKMALIR